MRSCPRRQSLLRYQPVCLWYHYTTSGFGNSERTYRYVSTLTTRYWGVLANSPQPWKRKRNFWHELWLSKVRLYVCICVSRVAGCLLKLATVTYSSLNFVLISALSACLTIFGRSRLVLNFLDTASFGMKQETLRTAKSDISSVAANENVHVYINRLIGGQTVASDKHVPLNLWKHFQFDCKNAEGEHLLYWGSTGSDWAIVGES